MNDTDPIKTTAEEGQPIAARAAQIWDSTKDKAGEALHSSERYVQVHPKTSLAGVFGAGLLLGVLIGWKAAHEERDDYAARANHFIKRWGHKLHLN